MIIYIVRRIILKRIILLISHGTLAEGLLSSATLILGAEQTSNINYINCYVDPKRNMEEEVKEFMNNNKECEIVVITDIFGGSVNNHLLNYINNDNVLLMSGASLPLLLETSLFNGNINELKQHIDKSKDKMIVVNDTLKTEDLEDDF